MIQLVNSQTEKLRINFDEDGNTYIKGSISTQFWTRYTEFNPGTMINNEIVNHNLDFSVRRLRFNLQSQLTPKLFFYSTFGGNNLNSETEKDWKISVLDLNIEYEVAKEFAIGFGKNGWDGLSRNLVRSSSTMMALDAPLFSLITINKNDDLGRGLGVWTKGQIGKFDYILSVKKPYKYGVEPTSYKTDYALNNPHMRTSGYVKYEFLDDESNKTAYSDGTGTYLGKKRIFNIGAGFLIQPKMTSRLVNNSEKFYDLQSWSAEIFYDTPVNKERNTAVTFYSGFYHTDFGPDYIRNISPNNYTSGGTSFNGPGNGYPMIGTGNTFFFQFGYLLGKNMLGKETFRGQLQPNIAVQHSVFEALDDPVTALDMGINWYFNGHCNKLTMGYQSRPIFEENTTGKIVEESHKGLWVLQYSISIN